MSLKEFIARPERADEQREELIRGELIVSPSPKFLHTAIVNRLHKALRPLEIEGFVLVVEQSCVIRPHSQSVSMPEPDLGVYSEAQCNAAAEADDYLQGAPRLAIDVWSASNRGKALGSLAEDYVENGAEQAWIVHPKKKTVTVYTIEGFSEARLDEWLELQGVTVPVRDIFPN